MNRCSDRINSVEVETHALSADRTFDESQRTRPTAQAWPKTEPQSDRSLYHIHKTPEESSTSNTAPPLYSRYLRSRRIKNATNPAGGLDRPREHPSDDKLQNLQGVFSNSTSKEFQSPRKEVKVNQQGPLQLEAAFAPTGQGQQRTGGKTFAKADVSFPEEGAGVASKELAGTREHSMHQNSSSQVLNPPERFSFGGKETEAEGRNEWQGKPQEDSLAMNEAQLEEYNQLLKSKSVLLSAISRNKSEKDALRQANQLLLKKLDSVAGRLHATFSSSS